jgi:hypothetical protein
MRVRRARRAVVVLLLGASAGIVPLACKKGPQGSDAGVAAASASSARPADGGLAALASSTTDRLWVEARGADPLELARLANEVGAHRLAEVADDDGASEDDRAAAFRALSFVEDPSPALPALTRAVLGSSIDRSMLALQTLAAVAPRRHPIEEVEPGAWRTAAEGILKALATPGGIQDPVRRELGIRALLGLVDRGAVKREMVPVQ